MQCSAVQYLEYSVDVVDPVVEKEPCPHLQETEQQQGPAVAPAGRGVRTWGGGRGRRDLRREGSSRRAPSRPREARSEEDRPTT